MSKLDAILKAQQIILDPAERGDGYCPNRGLCFRTRLGISEDAIEDGWRCAFEEHHALWQCHLSGKWEKTETT